MLLRDRDEPGRDRFLRRTDPFYQPHHSPKRRKLEAGEVEVVSDFNRRPSYPPSFELPPGKTRLHIVLIVSINKQLQDDLFLHVHFTQLERSLM